MLGVFLNLPAKASVTECFTATAYAINVVAGSNQRLNKSARRQGEKPAGGRFVGAATTQLGT
jgi:hypothetical protein